MWDGVDVDGVCVGNAADGNVKSLFVGFIIFRFFFVQLLFFSGVLVLLLVLVLPWV